MDGHMPKIKSLQTGNLMSCCFFVTFFNSDSYPGIAGICEGDSL